MSAQHLPDSPVSTGKPGGMVAFGRRHPFAVFSVALMAMLIAGAWISVIGDASGAPGFFSGETWSRGREFIAELAGAGSSRTPAFADGDSWKRVLGLARETVVMSVLAAGIAVSGVLLTVSFGASNLTRGDNSPFGPVAGLAVYGATRAAYLLTRAVPELVWALIIVFMISPGVLAGAMALAVHNFGVLGRLLSEVVEDIDPAPVRSLRSSGAGNLQVLFYGVLPQVLPQFVTYLVYRFEVIVRTSVVVGLVAAAGLGYQFRLDLAFLRHTDVALLLIVYVLLVWAVDLVSVWLRRLAR